MTDLRWDEVRGVPNSDASFSGMSTCWSTVEGVQPYFSQNQSYALFLSMSRVRWRVPTGR
ncbi:hypothetical protein ABZW11_18465 [Nonomuraea sp. NPDC004580]|uniref:hypothetical protein n=1 Tax=Nonomuraea sp. NPDC004580 TaxID=3154552 RepID=UPI0033BA4600